MNFIVRATIPNTAGNQLVKGPAMGDILGKVMGDVRPQATYFTIDKGQRTIYFIVDVAEGYQWPRVVEALWLGLQADVDVIPAMSQAEFEKAMPIIQQTVARY